MLFHKKASLEISIQAIVIVVLAMTLLGLGLGFIKGMFKDIGDTTTQVSSQIRERVLDDLVQGDKKVSFPETEINVARGDSKVLTIGVRNKGDTDLVYSVEFRPLSHVRTTGGAAIPITDTSTPSASELSGWFQFPSSVTYTLAPTESEVRNIKIIIPKSTSTESGSTGTPTGSYFIQFIIWEGRQFNDDGTPVENSGIVYAQKDFFLNVR